MRDEVLVIGFADGNILWENPCSVGVLEWYVGGDELVYLKNVDLGGVSVRVYMTLAAWNEFYYHDVTDFKGREVSMAFVTGVADIIVDEFRLYTEDDEVYFMSRTKEWMV